MSEAAAPLARLAPRGLELRVRLTPKSSSDRVEGACVSVEGPAIAARVRAVPADGLANAALERLVAEWLGVPKSCVALTAGQKSRIKTLTISGEPDVIAKRLAELIAQTPSRSKKR